MERFRASAGMIGDRYRQVVERVSAAAIRAGRKPEEVRVIVAAKAFGAEAVLQAIAAGARDVGENYVQEARRKQSELRSIGGQPDPQWHLIGRLQRNKARQALRLFDLIHSLDGEELAGDLDRAAAELGVVGTCLIGVNLASEATKGGVPVNRVEGFLERISSCPHLAIRGLMAIPPPGNHESSRSHFAKLRLLRDRLDDLRLPNVQLKELSMGMSSDFEAAVEEGATMVRIGTAIFGPRSTQRE